MSLLAVGSGVYAVIQRPILRKKKKASENLELEKLKKNHLEEQKRLEHNLKKAQKIAKLGSWEWDLNTGEMLWSEQMFEIYGLPKDQEPTIEAVQDLIFEEDKALYIQGIEDTYKGNPPKFIEYKILTPTGDIKHISAEGELTYDLDGNLIKISGIVQDVTERVKTIEAKLESEKNYRLLVDHSPTGVFKSNLDGDIIYANPAMVKMFGFSTEDELLKCQSEALYKRPEDRHALLTELKEKGRLSDYRMECKTRDGATFYVSQTSILEGNELHGILMDITDRVYSDEENVALINQLKEQNTDLEDFSYVISHNLRTPIVNLMGLTQVFDKATCSTQNLEILDLISQSTTNLDLIIKDLNKTLTIREKREEIYENVNLHSVLESVKTTLDSNIKSCGVLIDSNISESDEIKSISSFIQNIMHNLIDNAVKFSCQEKDSKVTISLSKKGRKNILTVSDNGVGMDLQEKDNRIFKLYERLDPKTSKVNGRGLGLYLVKNQVNALQGKIKVESELGSGTTFTVELPIKQ